MSYQASAIFFSEIERFGTAFTLPKLGFQKYMKLPYFSRFYQKIFRISPDEAKFLRRGFRITKSAGHLETVGEKFLYGYHAALSANSTSDLADDLNLVEPLYRGFAFEGAAMGLTLLDNLLPLRKKLLQEFFSGSGKAHIYMLHVGVGWALARIPWLRRRPLKTISRFDPVLRWLILDGFGFHEGYFYPRKYFHSKVSLDWLPGYARRAFAQGLGRSLWFVEGADTEKILQRLNKLPESLRSDLWSGIGLACAYAGDASEPEIEKLKVSAGEHYLSYLAQGAAFAAKARLRAGNPARHTEMACRVFCRCTIEEAAFVTDMKLQNLPIDGTVPAYEVWRQRIQKEFSLEQVTV